MFLFFLLSVVAAITGSIVSTKFGDEAGGAVTSLILSLATIVLKLCDIHDELIKQRK